MKYYVGDLLMFLVTAGFILCCTSGGYAESGDAHSHTNKQSESVAHGHGGQPGHTSHELHANRGTNAEGASLGGEEIQSSNGRRILRRRNLNLNDPRGAVDLTVCSQNLKLFGTYVDTKKRNHIYSDVAHQLRVQAITQRFVAARCDVIAVQELMGRSKVNAEDALRQVADALRVQSNRIFSVIVAPPVKGEMTTGFLVAEDRASVQQAFPYARVELPKLNKKGRPRMFSRVPFELQLLVPGKNGARSKIVTLVNFHFKSKRGGQDDPSGLEWETYRMEMAEALRRIVEQRHPNTFGSGESLLLLLGDRNSNYDVASARILEGGIDLAFFEQGGPCRLSKRGVPLCKKDQRRAQKLFSVLTQGAAIKKHPGTYSYKNSYSWLDDILVPQETLPVAWTTATSDGDYNAGVVYSPAEASDHALVYVRLNW
jgi:hypothetical protein